MEEKETEKKTATKKASTATAEKKTTTKKTSTTAPATAEKKTATKKATTATAEKKTTTKTASKKAEAVAEKTATPAVAEKKAVKSDKQLKITLVKSTIGALQKQKRTVQALGLSKIRSSVVKPDNACTRGMIFVVKHLVSVEEVK